MTRAAQEWFSAAELAELALPGLPATKRGVLNVATRNGWIVDPMYARPRKGRGGGVEFHLSLLPESARTGLVEAPGDDEGDRPDRDVLWMRWERLPASMRAEAERRLAVIQRVEQLERAGLRKGRAIDEVAAAEGREASAAGRSPAFSASTIYAWIRRLRHAAHADRVAYLAPDYTGRTTTEPCSREAFDAYAADYLRPSMPTHAACYRRLQRAAAERGWTLPSAKTMQRKLDAEIPNAVQLLQRKGAEALAHAFPHLERSRAGIGALQILNLDGHTWDNRVEWPDGTISRPLCLAVQDIASSKVLAVRFDQTLNQHLVRLALADVFRDYGLPQAIIMDNGRENAAASISGGQVRNRWKARSEEPAGLLTMLGIKAVATTPYWGQAKPIERMFRDWADEIAKHPAFEGSYVGKDTVSKPANYGARAIPIAEYEARIRAELVHYNAQLGRRAPHMAGRSFDQVFDALIARIPPRQATPEQLRLALLQSEPVSMDARDNAVKLLGGRYWSGELAAVKRQRVMVRFDPENLAAPVHVYSLSGRYLAQADRIAAGSFDSAADAQAQGRLKRDFVKKTKAAAEALVRMNVAEVAALHPVAPETAAPKRSRVKGDSNVIAPAFGTPRSAAGAAPTKPKPDEFNDRLDRSFNVLSGRR